MIDHVYSNDIHNTHSCNIITVGISDHLATLTTISLGKAKLGEKRAIKFNCRLNNDIASFRLHNEASNEKFKSLIGDENWDPVFNTDDASERYDEFCKIYTAHYDNSFPLKINRILRKNERQNPKPWILPWLEDACARKNDLHFTSVNSPTVANVSAYKKMNKFCEKHKKIACDKYHKKYFETYKDCSKKQWSMINNLLNRKAKSKNSIKLTDSSNTIISSDTGVANAFNDYFAGIAANMKDNIGPRMTFDPGGIQNFLDSPCQNSIFLRPTDQFEVHKIIKSFKNKSTLDTKVEALKIANTSFTFTNTLAKILNSSFQQGIFPQALKLAKVVPIHKEGAKNDVKNYRPISLLSVF